jgi:hypothetical protein
LLVAVVETREVTVLAVVLVVFYLLCLSHSLRQPILALLVRVEQQVQPPQMEATLNLEH